MSLSLKEVEFKALCANGFRSDQAWSHLELKFDDGTGHLPSVRLVLLQTVGPNTTISELERGATGLAKTILREALSVIEARSVTELIEDQDVRGEAERRESEANLLEVETLTQSLDPNVIK